MSKPKPTRLRRIAVAAEREAIHAAIAKHGTRTAAARVLGITTQTIRDKIGAAK